MNRDQTDRGTDFKQKIVEYTGNNCYIPISGMCFVKCIKYFTHKDYTDEFRHFIGNKKYLSGVMTSARIQPFCRKYNINIGCFDGKRINPRNITKRSTSLFLRRFCLLLIWKSDGISLNQAIEDELKANFKVVHNVLFDKHFKSLIKYEIKPKNFQAPITNMTIYDIETFNTIKCLPYADCIYLK